jgi:hypothetical protein
MSANGSLPRSNRCSATDGAGQPGKRSTARDGRQNRGLRASGRGRRAREPCHGRHRENQGFRQDAPAGGDPSAAAVRLAPSKAERNHSAAAPPSDNRSESSRRDRDGRLSRQTGSGARVGVAPASPKRNPARDRHRDRSDRPPGRPDWHVVAPANVDPRTRAEGLDWPTRAETTIGHKRLDAGREQTRDPPKQRTCAETHGVPPTVCVLCESAGEAADRRETVAALPAGGC